MPFAVRLSGRTHFSEAQQGQPRVPEPRVRPLLNFHLQPATAHLPRCILRLNKKKRLILLPWLIVVLSIRT